MLAPWLNTTIKIQRRSSTPSRNALNEPAYGAESGWPVIYTNVPTRIEYQPEVLTFEETGERVNPSANQTLLYLEPAFVVKPEDRITVLTSDDSTIVNKLYIAVAVFGEWNSMGGTHHYIVQLQVH